MASAHDDASVDAIARKPDASQSGDAWQHKTTPPFVEISGLVAYAD